MCESLQSIAIGLLEEQPKIKRRLSYILYEEQTSIEDEIFVLVKKPRVSYDDIEEDDFPETAALPVAELPERSSSSKNKKKQKERKEIKETLV